MRPRAGGVGFARLLRFLFFEGGIMKRLHAAPPYGSGRGYDPEERKRERERKKRKRLLRRLVDGLKMSPYIPGNPPIPEVSPEFVNAKQRVDETDITSRKYERAEALADVRAQEWAEARGGSLPYIVPQPALSLEELKANGSGIFDTLADTSETGRNPHDIYVEMEELDELRAANERLERLAASGELAAGAELSDFEHRLAEVRWALALDTFGLMKCAEPNCDVLLNPQANLVVSNAAPIFWFESKDQGGAPRQFCLEHSTPAARARRYRASVTEPPSKRTFK